MFYFPLFWASPVFYLTAIYVLAAVLPAIFLMRYVYRQDRIESEPPYLLGQLALLGVAAAVVSVVPEMLAQSLLDRWVGPENPRYVVLLAVKSRDVAMLTQIEKAGELRLFASSESYGSGQEAVKAADSPLVEWYEALDVE